MPEATTVNVSNTGPRVCLKLEPKEVLVKLTDRRFVISEMPNCSNTTKEHLKIQYYNLQELLLCRFRR